MAENKSTHSFRYENGKIIITGVTEIISFDEKEFTVRLQTSTLSLNGRDFKLEDTDVKSGLCSVNGVLLSAIYREKAEKMSFMKRLFK